MVGYWGGWLRGCPRTGLRPILLLDAATPSAPVASAAITVGAR